MQVEYEDIRKRITDPIRWFDEHGVPRYDAFEPAQVSIYASVSVLFEIECQGCGAKALIGADWHRMERFTPPTADDPGSVGYGDFPRRYCKTGGGGGSWSRDDWGGGEECAGVTMSTAVTRIVEYWHHPEVLGEWVRRPEMEREYPGFQGDE